jgi:hypothetical protein
MGSAPSGKDIIASCMRCCTCARAKYRSTSSSNVTVTTESPTFEIDRTSVVRGRPSIATSIGYVTWFSTSTGDSPGASVITRHLVRRQVGKGVRVERRERPDARGGDDERRADYKCSMSNRRIDDARDDASLIAHHHISIFGMLPFSNSAFTANAPVVTTTSPAARPSRIAARPVRPRARPPPRGA